MIVDKAVNIYCNAGVEVELDIIGDKVVNVSLNVGFEVGFVVVKAIVFCQKGVGFLFFFFIFFHHGDVGTIVLSVVISRGMLCMVFVPSLNVNELKGT